MVPLVAMLAVTSTPVSIEYSVWHRDGTTIDGLTIRDFDYEGGNPRWTTFDLVGPGGAITWRVSCASAYEDHRSDLVCRYEGASRDAPELVLTASKSHRLSGWYCAASKRCYTLAPNAPPEATGVLPWLEVRSGTTAIAWIDHGYDAHQEVRTSSHLDDQRRRDLVPAFLALGVTWDIRDMQASRWRPQPSSDQLESKEHVLERDLLRRRIYEVESSPPMFGPIAYATPVVPFHILFELLSAGGNLPLSDRYRTDGSTARGFGGGFQMYLGVDYADFITLYMGTTGGYRQSFDAERLSAELTSGGAVDATNGRLRLPIGARVTVLRVGDWRPYLAFEAAWTVVGGGFRVRSESFDRGDADSFTAAVAFSGLTLSSAIGTRRTLMRVGRGGTIDFGIEARLDFDDFGEETIDLRYEGNAPTGAVVARAKALQQELEELLEADARALGINVRVYLSVRY